MVGNKSYVVIDGHADGSGIVAVYGPFEEEDSAKAWPGMPGGPTGSYSVHQMYAAPEWFEGYESDESDE